MPKITVYGQPFGTSFRPHWMLNEVGLEYETQSVNLRERTPEFMALNPAGQIPVMQYDDFVLTESVAIVWYLAEKHAPQLFGPQSQESHAQLVRWIMFTMLNLNPHMTTLASKTWNMPATPEAEAKAVEALNRFLPVFEGWMQGKDYVLGTEFSIADVICRATFNYAEAAQFDLSAYPAITAWAARCAERPAYKKTAGK